MHRDDIRHVKKIAQFEDTAQKRRDEDRKARLGEYREFLSEYQALCERYGIYITACGCCDSPTLARTDESNTAEMAIRHLEESI